MRDVFERYLAVMVTRVKRRTERNFARELTRLGRQVAGAVGVAGSESKSEKKSRVALIKDLREGAALIDACEFIDWSFLSAPNGYSRTVPVRRGDPGTRMRVTQSSINDLFRRGEVPNRGQCYVAWSRAPVRVFYVGKGKSKNRLDLRKHGCLSDTLASATLLSLVFPATKAHLGGLEASLMAVIAADQGGKPTGIVRMERRIPAGVASRDLGILESYFGTLARSLRSRKRGSARRIKPTDPANQQEPPPEVEVPPQGPPAPQP